MANVSLATDESMGLPEEEFRLATLRELGLLDTEPEVEFDELAKLAAEVCSTPIGLFTLVDEKRQWFKASVGLALRETGRDLSFCAHAIQQEELFEVRDAAVDERFRENALVTGDPAIRFYAGMPVKAPNGEKVGTLCVIDTIPRSLTDTQAAAMKVLARQVTARMELREQQRRLTKALREKEDLLAELRSSEHRFRTFMDNAPCASYMKDADGRMLYYNQKMAERFGVEVEEWAGKSDRELWGPEVAEEFHQHDLQVIEAGHMIETIESTPTADGRTTTWKSYKFPWKNDRGEVMLGGFSVDMSAEIEREQALVRANEQLEELATKDGLTGLMNRRTLDERAAMEFEFARRHKTALAVIMLDIDGFKQRNDEFGHASGDEVLRQMGRLIRATVRVTDLAARYGGEELAVLLPGMDTEGARHCAERIQTAMQKFDWPHRPVTASFGTAGMDTGTHSPKCLIELADRAMYEAKRTGRDRIVSYGIPPEGLSPTPSVREKTADDPLLGRSLLETLQAAGGDRRSGGRSSE